MELLAPHPAPGLLFQKVVALLELWLTERQVAEHLSAISATSVRVSAAMSMLASAARKGAALADMDHPMARFESRCVEVSERRANFSVE